MKFTTMDGGRLRTRISRFASRICQPFDGVTVNGPDRTHPVGAEGHAGRVHPAVLRRVGQAHVGVDRACSTKQAPQGIVRYLDSATFHGTLTSQ